MELAARFNPSAVLTPEERARRMSDRYLDLSEKPEYVLEWPFELLTKHCSGIYPGEYWVIAGETGGGKTTLLNRLVFQWAKMRPALVCNTEMTWEAMGDRHVADITGLTIKEIRGGGYSDETSAKIQGACGEVSESDLYHLYLGAHDNGLAAIRQQAKQLQAAHGLGCIAVDYLQEVKVQLGNRASSYDRTTAVSAGLREIGRDLRVPVVAISSLNRHSSSRPTASKLPQLSDLRGSGDIEFQADGVIFLSKATTISSKEEDKNLVILQLAKNRAEGAIGRVDLVWSESDRLHRQSVMN
jgi:replicative DNA helicase